MSLFSNIICCMSLSDRPDDVAQYVEDLARIHEAKVTVVYGEPEANSAINRTAAFHEVKNSESLAKDEESFRNFVESRFSSIKTDVKIVGEADLEKHLLEVVDSVCADLVVIGAASANGIFSSFVNRSVGSIINSTRVPVMIIPSALSLECEPEK